MVFHDTSEPGPSAEVIRVVIAAAQASTSTALRAVLTPQNGVEIVSVETTSARAIAAAERLSPDVVLVDDDLEDLDGVATATLIGSTVPAARVIIMSDKVDEEVVIGSIAAGGAGALERARIGVDALTAVRAAHRGETHASRPELQRLLTPVRGRRSPAMAVDLTAGARRPRLHYPGPFQSGHR